MKKALLVIAIFFANVAVMAQTQANTENGPILTFAEEKFEFGDIHQGDKVEHTFKFENEGNEPLIISNVLTTCGCTVPEWPREPIAPGAVGEIHVVFSSANKSGKQNKVITVLSNASENGTKVSLTGNVTVGGTN